LERTTFYSKALSMHSTNDLFCSIVQSSYNVHRGVVSARRQAWARGLSPQNVA